MPALPRPDQQNPFPRADLEISHSDIRHLADPETRLGHKLDGGPVPFPPLAFLVHRPAKPDEIGMVQDLRGPRKIHPNRSEHRGGILADRPFPRQEGTERLDRSHFPVEGDWIGLAFQQVEVMN